MASESDCFTRHNQIRTAFSGWASANGNTCIQPSNAPQVPLRQRTAPTVRDGLNAQNHFPTEINRGYFLLSIVSVTHLWKARFQSITSIAGSSGFIYPAFEISSETSGSATTRWELKNNWFVEPKVQQKQNVFLETTTTSVYQRRSPFFENRLQCWKKYFWDFCKFFSALNTTNESKQSGGLELASGTNSALISTNML